MSKQLKGDTEEYQKKKRFYDSVLTIFGRKPVLEALQNPAIKLHRLHLATSNKTAGIIEEICELARKKDVEILYHDKQALSRISKNSKQDQGIALDIQTPGFEDFQHFLDNNSLDSHSFIALDRITNPQNLGMILRTVCASPTRAIILPRKGCAKLDSLVIKASAGTLFKASILWCDSLEDCLKAMQDKGAKIICLDAKAPVSLNDYKQNGCSVFVLGNETHGPGNDIQQLSDLKVSIPMMNGVESLNVAVTAGIIAFRQQN